ncbi:hypothetical protein Ais01nite_31480 [Asanoa ishikariensis]|uniref:Uncharacterized protein n=1 Tax=Asanoa ishikariensis TaxID=137265 RepID=A0A1H3UV60_9ACTN|nr:hypothetical protein [Asanoa ishikariensis]GIF65113.1 hypothetical protein Ais01nite_31480 [Asanoa ishikariensis]SDZ66294.1 hypothetical protein SAMN05421684_8147 [Asanoa ishikariensis]
MPDSDENEQPRGRPLLKLLFWAGVGLAPIAMLLLLLADGNGPLRIAAVLAVLAVVLIGLSIGLRGDADSIRVELEDMVADEIDGLQGDVRRDIETAARATHRQLGERVQALQQSVDAMRAQLDAQRAGPRPPAVGVPAQAQARDPGTAQGGGTYGGGAAREGATYGRADGATYGSGRASTGAAYGGGGESGGYGRESADDERAANPQPAMASPSRTYGAPAEGTAAGAARPPRARVPGGVVRHTETVQVTTRHTVVDGRGGGGGTYGTGDVYGERYQDENRYGADSRYGEDKRYGDDSRQGEGEYGSRRTQDDAADYDGGGYGRRRRADEEPAASWGSSGEESFTDRRLRELRADQPAIERGDAPAYDDQWSSSRGGDRWAAVRSDDRGRELRMGERRASVRADESGTEYRVEDRWAAVRRDDDRPADGPGAWYADAWQGEQNRGGAGTYGRGQDSAVSGEWSRDRGADREAEWGRGGYDDDRGGDDRWR